MIQWTAHEIRQDSNHEDFASHVKKFQFRPEDTGNDIIRFPLHQVKDALYQFETSLCKSK